MPRLPNYAAPLRWDARTGRYRDRRGRFVPGADVLEVMEAALDRAAQAAAASTQALRDGRLALAVWQRQMQATIKAVHVVNAALAHGGIPRLDGAALARVRGTVRTEYGYLARLAEQVASGQQALDGRLAARARQYVLAGRTTFSTEQGQVLLGLGFDQERNRLNSRDTCPGCSAATARGWVAIGTLPPVGTRTCLRNCRCRLEYRATATGTARQA